MTHDQSAQIHLRARVTTTRSVVDDREVHHIRIEDEASGMRIAEAELSPDEFARTVSGKHGECDVILYSFPHFGRRFQSKEIEVALPLRHAFDDRNAWLDACNEIIAENNVDGWVGNPYDPRSESAWSAEPIFFIPEVPEDGPGELVGYSMWCTYTRWVDPSRSGDEADETASKCP